MEIKLSDNGIYYCPYDPEPRIRIVEGIGYLTKGHVFLKYGTERIQLNGRGIILPDGVYQSSAEPSPVTITIDVEDDQGKTIISDPHELRYAGYNGIPLGPKFGDAIYGGTPFNCASDYVDLARLYPALGNPVENNFTYPSSKKAYSEVTFLWGFVSDCFKVNTCNDKLVENTIITPTFASNIENGCLPGSISSARMLAYLLQMRGLDPVIIRDDDRVFLGMSVDSDLQSVIPVSMVVIQGTFMYLVLFDIDELDDPYGAAVSGYEYVNDVGIYQQDCFVFTNELHNQMVRRRLYA
ncbi:MAG: hypothetical protein II855_04520 [Candidatus Methanomethylophilaceae archaeon]|nr:hypothetical protein [Candidatus Methanomethylophilaceae archaeon]